MESSQILFQGILAWCASFGTSAKSLRESALNTLTGRGHMVVESEKTNGHNSVVCIAINQKFSLLLGLQKGYKYAKFHGAACNSSRVMALQKFEKLAVLPPLLENEIRYRAEICFILFTIKGLDSVQKINKSAAPERAQNGAKILHYGLWEK